MAASPAPRRPLTLPVHTHTDTLSHSSSMVYHSSGSTVSASLGTAVSAVSSGPFRTVSDLGTDSIDGSDDRGDASAQDSLCDDSYFDAQHKYLDVRGRPAVSPNPCSSSSSDFSSQWTPPSSRASPIGLTALSSTGSTYSPAISMSVTAPGGGTSNGTSWHQSAGSAPENWMNESDDPAFSEDYTPISIQSCQPKHVIPNLPRVLQAFEAQVKGTESGMSLSSASYNMSSNGSSMRQDSQYSKDPSDLGDGVDQDGTSHWAGPPRPAKVPVIPPKIPLSPPSSTGASSKSTNAAFGGDSDAASLHGGTSLLVSASPGSRWTGLAVNELDRDDRETPQLPPRVPPKIKIV
jgi:hypothetical protein